MNLGEGDKEHLICVLCDPRVFKLLELPIEGMVCLEK